MKLRLLVKATTFTLAGLALGLFVLASPALARTQTYELYSVVMDVNEDSTVDITERVRITFDGEYRGVLRQITLDNRSRADLCNSAGRTCGGFERIALIGVYDEDGRQLDPREYDLGIVTDTDTGSSYYEIKWEVWPGGQFHNDLEFEWTVKYRVYGSLGWIGSDPTTANPYLYWNALPEYRGGSVRVAEVIVNFPNGTRVDKDDLELFTNISGLNYVTDQQRSSVAIGAQNLPSYGDFTIAYPIPRSAIDRPAQLTYSAGIPMTGVGLVLDGVDLGDIGGRLDNFPIGEHSLVFYRDGYSDYETIVDVDSEEQFHIQVTMEPTPLTVFGLLLTLCLNLFGVILIPIGLVWVYLRWQNKGRDINAIPSINPKFSPPDGVEPYMLGSIKDETVDREDITGTIIDLAYRGYIKIKEVKQGKDYELTKLQGKSGDKLNETEEQLIDFLFGSKDSVRTKDLGDTFAAKYPRLVKRVYKEMVSRGYFSESPETTRAKYLAAGIGLMTFGVVIAFFLGFIWFPWVGVPGPFFLGLALILSGIAQMITSQYMPAKTTQGSKIFADIKGFQMYLHHAERYRLQGLEPEEFEKYLSYAIVFGIEKQWAKKFEDIYKGQPEWFETNRDILWDAYWMSRFARSFSTGLNNTVYQSLPKGTGSAAGSGWSGSVGSFGGFSGGGGGGGFSGGF